MQAPNKSNRFLGDSLFERALEVYKFGLVNSSKVLAIKGDELQRDSLTVKKCVNTEQALCAGFKYLIDSQKAIFDSRLHLKKQMRQ